MSKKFIKLTFLLKIFGYESEEDKIIIVENLYNSEKTLNDILISIYHKYSKNIYNKEDVGLKGHCILIYEPNLFEKTYKFEGIKYEPSVYDYHECKLKELEQQFNISKHKIELWLDPGIGGDVGRCRGIHFFFHTSEKDIHHRPHIHCKCGQEEFRVDLEKIKIMDKPFKNKKRTNLAMDIINKNQDQLIDYWNKVVINGEFVKLKIYVPHC